MVKVGGGSSINWDELSDDLARIWRREPVVVVHGASKELDRISSLLGHPPVPVHSMSGIQSRYTDDATMDIFTMVYAGSANAAAVQRLRRSGVDAVGLSGLDGAVLRCREKGVLRTRDADGRQRVLRGDRTGVVTEVNSRLLHLLLGAGYMPVLCPPAISDQQRAMNVDGDRAAAQVARALAADTLVLLSDVPGLLLDPADPSTLVKDVRRHEIGRAMEIARGRMRLKVLAAREALQAGVDRVVLSDGRVSEPISRACRGEGTVFRRRAVPRSRE
ncbi:MAG TPA: [LysW]-aminoadipate kinase [Candidatus Dormibacteraeota bacterium]|nr:[LysW]-aminoadipate kinase [Candidatus Dormibacteraeota bacterium]